MCLCSPRWYHEPANVNTGIAMRPSGGRENKRIILSIFGMALLVTAVVIVLKGFGVLAAIPGFVILALVLITVGVGILAGLS